MKSFRIFNIKSFIDSHEIELRPITILAGKNSSGKSAIVRFPVVLKQSFSDDISMPISLNGKYIDYGNFKDVVHNQKENSSLTYEISFDDVTLSDEAFILQDKKPNFENMTLKFDIQYKESTIFLNEYCIFVDKQKLISISGNKAYLYLYYDFKSEDSKFIEMPNIVSFEIILQKKIDIFINTNQFNSQEFDLIRPTIFWIKSLQLNKLLTEFSENLIYISSLRRSPERIFRIIENKLNYVGILGENTANVLKQNSQLLNDVSKWISTSFDYNLEIENENPNFFEMKVQHKGKNFKENLFDIGSGISQVLPIITQIYFNNTYNENKLFVIEEPEIHLHPNAQVELAELLATIASKTKLKFLIETHSEHIIRKLQSIVANPAENFNNEDIIIYQTDLNLDGCSTVDKIELNEKGQFKTNWKSGFLDKAYQLSKELIINNSKSK